MGRERITLQRNVTISAAQLTAGSGVIRGTPFNLGDKHVKRLALILDVTSHDNTNANETYDFYVWTGFKMPNGNYAYWDIGAFTQVSGASAAVRQGLFAQNEGYPGVHTIADGTITKEPANLADVITTSTRETITAAFARHGFIGDFIGYTLKGGGTTPGPIVYEIAGMIWT